VISLDSL